MSHTDNGQHFAGGARRSDRKPRFDLFEFLEAVAEVLTDGAAKYGLHNWKRWRKDFFLDAWNHAFVHLQKFKKGDRREDHLAHLACNVAFLIWAVRSKRISMRALRSRLTPVGVPQAGAYDNSAQTPHEDPSAPGWLPATDRIHESPSWRCPGASCKWADAAWNPAYRFRERTE